MPSEAAHGLLLVKKALAADIDAFLGGKNDDRLFDVLLPVKEWLKSNIENGVYRKLVTTPEWVAFAQRFGADVVRVTDEGALEAQWDAARARRDRQ